MERAIARLKDTALYHDDTNLQAICERYRGWSGIGPVPSHWRWTQVVLDINFLLNALATVMEEHDASPTSRPATPAGTP